MSTATSDDSRSLRHRFDRVLTSLDVTTAILTDSGEGHQVRRFLHEQLWDVSLRFDDRPTVAAPTRWLGSRHGRRTQFEAAAGTAVLSTPAPENAFSDVAVTFRTDIVVATDIATNSWQAIRRICADLGLPSVLVIDDEDDLIHLRDDQFGHDLVLATSNDLSDEAALLGARSSSVGTPVDVSIVSSPTSGAEIVVLAPLSDAGRALFPELANTFPTTPFVFQVHGRLDRDMHQATKGVLDRCPNVLVRSTADTSNPLGHAGLVLAPDSAASRRGLIGAVERGIPVIGSRHEDTHDLIGPAGPYVSESMGLIGWTDAIARFWQDPSEHAALERRARARASLMRREFRDGVRGALVTLAARTDEIRLGP